MRLISFLDDDKKWRPVEVELELWPGLPEIHFTGRPDQHLRESAKRIKSAIRAQGFEYPVGQQILVNLKPSYLKKSSRGIELAVAAAYLMESGQIPRWVGDSKTAFYGELSLGGEVSAPEGLAKADCPPDTVFVTGKSEGPLPFAHQEVRCLKDLFSPTFHWPQKATTVWRPDDAVLNLEVPEALGRLLAITALGQHSILLAGAAGSGKTTAAKILHALLPPPSDDEITALLRNLPTPAPETAWRPFIQPHHTIPMHSLLGGGNEAHGGELARADLGLLLFDEFLEFSPQVVEALREPLEQRKMRVSRGRTVHEYDLRAQFVATTNLCPCGDFIPGGGFRRQCRFTLKRCQSYSQKISGPLLDRFQILKLMSPPSAPGPRLLVRDLHRKLEDLRQQRAQEGRSLGIEPLDEIKSRTHPFYLKQEWDNQIGSERRRIATLRVAQSVCDWDGDTQVKGPHFKEALQLTSVSFERIKRWDLG